MGHKIILVSEAEANGIQLVFQPNTRPEQYKKGFPYGRYAWTAYDIKTGRKLATGDDQKDVYRQALAKKNKTTRSNHGTQ